MYAQARRTAKGNPPRAWETWRTRRDELFATHPQSPLAAQERAAFEGLPYFPYDQDWRLLARVEFVEPRALPSIHLGEDGLMRMAQVALLEAHSPRGPLRLGLYWILGYGGGLFLPFAEATSGARTYAGGRYLLDTIKGADLGRQAKELILDFNYAYNPSCAYDPRWVCPLAPAENRLPFELPVGERAWTHA
jgi:hypothetical protein